VWWLEGWGLIEKWAGLGSGWLCSGLGDIFFLSLLFYSTDIQ
jgi:hypothetical protein